jgi:putative membrane protein
MNRKTSTLMSLGISIALIAAGIWFLCNHQNSLGYGDGSWVMPNHLMTGGEGMGFVMVLFWVAVLSAIGLVISGVIFNRRSSKNTDSEVSSDAVEILKQRYARGEIDKSQFEAMKHELN